MTEFTPQDELHERIQRLQKLMRAGNIEGALIVQRADLFYFSGTAQNAHLFIPAEGEPLLLVKKNLARARRESALSRVEEFPGWNRLAEAIGSTLPSGAKIGLEMDVIPANLYLRYQKLFAPATIADISWLIRRIRAVKSPFELEQMRHAAALAEKMFGYAREILAAGMSEVEFAARLEAFLRARGHQGAVRMRGFNQELFYGQIMSGENAAVLSFFDGPTGGPGLNPSYPQGAGDKKIRRHEPVLVDFVSVSGGYMVDQTRIFCLGELPLPLPEAYETALTIKKDLISMGKAGVPVRELYLAAAELARRDGFADYFMGCEEKVNFIGHGVGLELDELPVITPSLDMPLEEGAVFALEPKFIFPGRGVVGIEDTFVVCKNGLEQITRFDDGIQYI